MWKGWLGVLMNRFWTTVLITMALWGLMPMNGFSEEVRCEAPSDETVEALRQYQLSFYGLLQTDKEINRPNTRKPVLLLELDRLGKVVRHGTLRKPQQVGRRDRLEPSRAALGSHFLGSLPYL